MKWDLDRIYTSINSKEYKKDIEDLNLNIKEFNLIDIDKNFTLEDFKKYFLMYEKVYSLHRKLYSYIYLRLSTDSKDKDALNENSYLMDKNVSIALMESRLIKILNGDLLESINSDPDFSDYRFLIKELYEKSKHLLSDEVEETMTSLLNYGAISYGDMQERLVSKFKVKIDLGSGEEFIPLTKCRSLLEEDDRSLRLLAINAEKEVYKYMEDPISFSLNNIKKSVIYDVKKRGYESPLSKSLIDNKMKEETLNSLIEGVKESLPLFRDFLKSKGSLLGDSKVYYSDLFASTRKTSKEIDFDYAKEFLKNSFKSFSPKVYDFACKAFDNRWIDPFIREGKVGGAFCFNIPSIGESRILLNFNNSYDSVFTLAHELGHAYHGEILKHERAFNTDYPMTIAETASIFFETLVCDKAFSLEEDINEKIIILEYELNSAAQIVLDIYSRFLFEREVFKRCENEFLTPEDLNDIMLRAQKESYGDSMHDYFKEAWIYKSHYYDFNYNFYNYPYTFGLLFSLGIYNLYLNGEKDFHNKYEEMLKVSGRSYLEDLSKIFNIDITNKEFFKSSLDILKDKYLKYRSLIDKN